MDYQDNTSNSETPFKQITLYQGDVEVGWFYCPLISKEAVSWKDFSFHRLDVMWYIHKILNNIALDSRNKIARSVPLGHLGNYDSIYSPQRFMEQVMAFEYLFDKLDHKKAKDPIFSLKMNCCICSTYFHNCCHKPNCHQSRSAIRLRKSDALLLMVMHIIMILRMTIKHNTTTSCPKRIKESRQISIRDSAVILFA